MANNTRKEESNEKKSTFRVRQGHTLTMADPEVEGAITILQPGDTVELTEKEAAPIPHAVEKGERRAHDGHTRRLKARIAELEEALRQSQADERQRNTPDKGKARAEKSLKNRGDNYIGRGQRDVRRTPANEPDTTDLIDDGSEDDTEELSGGMKGMARAQASGGSGSGQKQQENTDPNASGRTPESGDGSKK